MGLEHLVGKRSGRPKGLKSAPAWVRALKWAERHLDRLEAVPPSPLAARLVALGREHPDRFVACLALADQTDAGGVSRQKPPRNPAVADRPGRFARFTLVSSHLVGHLTGARLLPWLRGLPHGAKVVNCACDREVDALVFTVESGSLPPVAAGAPIPDLKAALMLWQQG
jgi:hypothetical protein